MKFRLAGTVNDSIVDGPGIRYSVFVQGCTHKCPGCQNPQTHDPAGGKEADTDDLLVEISKNPLLKGITLSGGEPFEQPLPMIDLCEKVREKGLDVWGYTGYLYEDIASGKLGDDARRLLELCDVLVDGPFVESQKSMSLHWRGSANQRVIDVPKSLETGEVVLRES
ncbi:MAG: anaerobic ribonucleoside-triphosphate reductase activating protein [Coriobacteriales bacterium]|jgi:anaerobic ribonucleoside-triphosphate reductase activating protein